MGAPFWAPLFLSRLEAWGVGLEGRALIAIAIGFAIAIEKESTN